VAGALGLELARELPLRLGARDDRVDLLRRTTDDRLGRARRTRTLEVLKSENTVSISSAEYSTSAISRMYSAEQHRSALAHQVGARADRAGGVGQ